jgi:hypothetical protein
MINESWCCCFVVVRHVEKTFRVGPGSGRGIFLKHIRRMFNAMYPSQFITSEFSDKSSARLLNYDAQTRETLIPCS